MLQANTILDLSAIKAILPHRNPVLMLDRVQVVEADHLIGVKNLSINEPFFQGHFPGHPIMPGVLQIEAMKQLAEIAVRGELDPEGCNDVYLWKLAKAKFRNPNVPGDRAKVEVKVESITDGVAVINGSVCNSGGVTCEAQFSLKMRAKSAPSEMPEMFNDYDRAAGFAKEIGDVVAVMPHRFPFLLIDGIRIMEEARAVAVKNLTGGEAMFMHAAEDYAVMPETVLCEILAQAGCACVLARPENNGKLGLFAALMDAESFAPVYPGDQLVVDVDLPPARKAFGKGSGKIYVNGKVVFQSSLMFAIVDPA
ncbi:MAG: 3-hydroxyacyl-ACP dehydratase FabZ [Lentisphaerae bacterium]|nr:3-hydroxyacyl-ACP dehydratase FabZ [Lentisphaerota bacterium]